MPGPDEFEAELFAMGLRTERRGELVVVEVDVPLGVVAGSLVEVATDPPPDFPRIPPHWVHLEARFELPGGGRNPSELGTGWSKGSRQHPCWRAERGVGSQWLAHIRALVTEASFA
jgi:hypothetical protein